MTETAAAVAVGGAMTIAQTALEIPARRLVPDPEAAGAARGPSVAGLEEVAFHGGTMDVGRGEARKDGLRVLTAMLLIRVWMWVGSERGRSGRRVGVK